MSTPSRRSLHNTVYTNRSTHVAGGHEEANRIRRRRRDPRRRAVQVIVVSVVRHERRTREPRFMHRRTERIGESGLTLHSCSSGIVSCTEDKERRSRITVSKTCLLYTSDAADER